MTDNNNGGAAFPHTRSRGHLQDQMPGMSLRDWFAGQIAAGMASRDGSFSSSYIAIQSYLTADAMLAERLLTARNGDPK